MFIILLTASNGHMLPAIEADSLEEARMVGQRTVESGKAWKATILDAEKGGKVGECRRGVVRSLWT